MFKYPLSTESKVLCYALNNPEVDVSRSVSYTTMNSTSYDQCTLNGTCRISATGWNFLIKIEIFLN